MSLTRLALLGGEPVRRKPYPAHNTIGEEERAAVTSVLDSGLLSGFVAGGSEEFLGGPEVRRLEAAYCAKFRAKHAVAFNSATSALHACVAAAGIGPGDEVITSPYSMSASATCVLMQNAVPVFADVEERTFCLDPDSVVKLITPRTRAIVAVNLLGQPAELGALREIARRHALRLIEDNAQAPGATYRGRYTGTIGDMGVFSLNRHKTIQCGEGGIAVVDDSNLALRLQLLRNHGETVVESHGDPTLYGMIGWNYRMTELQAAVARAQVQKLDWLNAWRVRLAEHLTKRLRGCEYLEPPAVRAECSHVYYSYAMRIRSDLWGVPRDSVVKALVAEGIPVGRGYAKPLHLLPLFRRGRHVGGRGCGPACPAYQGNVDYREGLCPVAERLYRDEVLTTNICRYPAVEADVDDLVAAVEKVFANRDALRGWSEG